MKVHISKDIEIPKGIYCNGCPRMRKDGQGIPYCEEFTPYLYKTNDGMSKVLKCNKCFEAMRKELTGRNY